MFSQKMQKKQTDFKLPQIRKLTKENSKVLSKTLVDSNCTLKTRPASSNKVDDLEKKLFNKLDAYENVSKKCLGKRTKKDGKETAGQIGAGCEPAAEGYQKIQKLMPNLYSKLIDTKKGNLAMIQAVPKPTYETPIIKSQKLIRRQSSNENKSTKQPQPLTIEVTPLEYHQQKQYKISESEMQQIYRQYEGDEELIPQTSKQQLQQLGKSINFYESEIQNLKKSMEGLIQQIGIEFLAQIGNDNEQG